MKEIKPKQLNLKQEKFCREYVLCMNASEAYRRVYVGSQKWKPTSVWAKASNLLAKDNVKARIKELKGDLENLLGINKATELKNLMKIRERCLKPEPKLIWIKNDQGKMEQVQDEDEEGNLIWQFDSAGANSAQDKIFKAMGYYAVEKKDITSNGETIIIDDKDKDIALKVLKDSD